MKKMVLLGGGRWARVLMSVLAEVLPADWQVLWVTHHGRQAAEQWCREQQQQRRRQQPSGGEHGERAHGTRPADWIEVSPQVSDAQLSHMQGAVVATSPHTHGDWLLRLLRAGVPTLCEKPLVLDPQQAEQLERQAIADNCALGVNLELHYATYVEQFAQLVSELDAQLAALALPGASLASRSTHTHSSQITDSQAPDTLDDAERRATLLQTVDMLDDAERRATLLRRSQSANSRPRHVEVHWLDPWSEVRYGETKYSDVYTNIVEDMFPHCWSLLRQASGVDDWCVERVEYLFNSDVLIWLVQGDVSAIITLSRRAPERTRRLLVQLAASDAPAVEIGAGSYPSQAEVSGLGTAKSGTAKSGTAKSGTAKSGTAKSGTAKSGSASYGGSGGSPSEFTVELDFSPEPGFIVQAGERRELQWAGERPLARSLKSFLEVIDAHRTGARQLWQSWPLSIVSCRQCVRVSTAIAEQLHRAQQHWLDRCAAGDEVFTGAEGAEFRQRLWFDMFVPSAAAAGQRVEFTDPQHLQAFYDSIAQQSPRPL